MTRPEGTGRRCARGSPERRGGMLNLCSWYSSILGHPVLPVASCRIHWIFARPQPVVRSTGSCVIVRTWDVICYHALREYLNREEAGKLKRRLVGG